MYKPRWYYTNAPRAPRSTPRVRPCLRTSSLKDSVIQASISLARVLILQDEVKISEDRESLSNIWRVAQDQKILWRFWEGDYVIYSALSGGTHMLDITSGKVLTRIMDRPSTIYDIRLEIADYLEVANDTELAKAVSNILKRLEDIGLIEPET